MGHFVGYQRGGIGYALVAARVAQGSRKGRAGQIHRAVPGLNRRSFSHEANPGSLKRARVEGWVL